MLLDSRLGKSLSLIRSVQFIDATNRGFVASNTTVRNTTLHVDSKEEQVAATSSIRTTHGCWNSVKCFACW